jgi:hypothetical protein
MQLTKLRAAPVLQAEVPPCAPAAGTDGGTASQLIRSVRPTHEGAMRQAVRVAIGAGVITAGVWSSGCIGSCDLYREVRPLGRTFEIHRVDMDYLYRRSTAPEHERFITRLT